MKKRRLRRPARLVAARRWFAATMAARRCLYEALGVDASVGTAELRAAFQRKALAAHPDRGGSCAALSEVMCAFELLSDPARRAHFDRQRIGPPASRFVERPVGAGGTSSGHIEAPTPPAARDLGAPRVSFTQQASEEAEAAVLARLHGLLQRLPSGERRYVLAERFSEAQRVALERWMLRQRAACSTSALAQVRPPEPVAKIESCSQSSLPTQSHSVARLRGIPCDTLGALARVQGVVRLRRGAHRYYYACAAVGGLMLRSRTDKDLGVALGFQVALMAIKQRTMANSAGCFESRFREAVQTTLVELGLKACARLKFVVRLRTLGTSRYLRTPPYTVCGELECGIKAWRRLRDVQSQLHETWKILLGVGVGKEAAWMRFRHEYLAILAEAGRGPEVAMPRLDDLEGQWLRARAADPHAHAARGGKRLTTSKAAVPREGIGACNRRSAAHGPSGERSIRRLLVAWARTQAPRVAATTPSQAARLLGGASKRSREGIAVDKLRKGMSCCGIASSALERPVLRSRWDLGPSVA